MRKNHSKIVCIKLVHLPYLYIWCTVTLISRNSMLVRCSNSNSDILAAAHQNTPRH